MKRIATLIGKPLLALSLLATSLASQAQVNVKVGLYPIPGMDSLEVRILPDAAFSGYVQTVIFTVRYETVAGVTMGGTSKVSGYWPNSFAQPDLDVVNTDGAYTYVTYTVADGGNIATHPWSANVERPFFRIGYSNTSGSCVTFLALDDAYQASENISWYMTLNDPFPIDDAQDGYIPGDRYPVKNTSTGELFCSIQAAIDDSQTLTGHTIEVAAGTYAESIVVTKGLTLLGPNANINPCSGVRVAEAVITASGSQPFYDYPGATEIRMIEVEASDVTIKGFTMDGDNTALTSPLNAGGANIDAADGIDVFVDGVSALLIENNIFKNLNETGFGGFPSGASATSGNAVINNTFQNIPGASDPGYIYSGYGIGAIPYNNFYCTVDNNCMTDVRIGVQTGNWNLADPGNSHSISNNSISGFGVLGVWHNLAYQSASAWVINGNTMTTSNNTTSSGLLITSLQQTVGVTATGNSVTGAFAGVELWNNPTSSTVTVSGGTLTNCVNGVFANNFDGYSSNADASSYVLNGISIIGGTRGVYVKDNSNNTNGATVAVTMLGGVTSNGSTTGLRLEGAGASAVFSGAGPASFSGATTHIEEVTNGTDKPAAAINATAVSFDGQTGATATTAQLFAIEDKIFHRIDDRNTGLVTVKANHLHVTDIASATATNNDYTRLRNAVEAVSNNWTINLSGSFDWVEANANAKWVLGNDEVASTSDDYGILPPANLNGVTFTAPAGLGTASILGPGDVATIDLEGVFYFDGSGTNKNWTISNIDFQNFDLPIGMFDQSGGGGVDEYDGTTITNNHFLLPADRNGADFPSDAFQNIGLHYSFGVNQTISNNVFDVDGSGASNGGSFSTTVVMQSNTSGGAVYDGLTISNNTINVNGSLNAQPSVILGFWENAHAHVSDITVSNNTFNNNTGANASTNLMRAFRVTSHSGASTTVTYSGNSVNGANIGMQWITGSNFATQQPVVVSANTFTDNATGILVQSEGKATVTNNFFSNPASSAGAVAAMSLGATGTANTITANDNSLLNNGNPLGKLAVNPGTGTISATCNWWGSSSIGSVSPLLTGTVNFIPIRTNGTDSDLLTAGFQPVGGSCGGYPVVNTTTGLGYMTIQAGHDDPLTLSGHTLALDAWTFNERVTLSKSLTLDGANETTTILTGTGLVGTGSGITLNNGVTGVTIQDLTVKNFAGITPNNSGGIYAIGGNNNIDVLNVTLKDNVGGAGFYANGPVDDVTLNNLDVSGHTNVNGAARGIVIWNGLKSNITITNCDVYNNNCCGIELQDGTASGVTMTGNNVHDNGDNGIGLTGLGGTVGANVVANNTLTNNGRYGMEVKMPGGNGTDTGAGSVVVENNTVTFVASVGMNNRDHAGIAVFRRGMLPANTNNNVDIPRGVVVRGNTVSGYQQLNPGAINSEGFGIVIEGVDHSVSNNTVSGNDVGLQLQGGGHNVANYVENSNGDGLQDNGQSPNYFGRGNAPYVCNVTVTGSGITGNGVNERVVTGAGVLSLPSASNQKAKGVNVAGTTYCTIQKAVDKATAGQTANVYTASYDEQVLVNKSMTIDGASPKPTVDFTGTVSGKPTLFDVSAQNVVLRDMAMNVDMRKLSSAVIATSATGIGGLQLLDNDVMPYGSSAGASVFAYGDRNAFSVNYTGSTNYRVSGGGGSVTMSGNTVGGRLATDPLANGTARFFRSGLSMDECFGTMSSNTLLTINHDLLVRFSLGGAVNLTNNTCNGGGLEVTEPNAGTTSISVTGNILDGAFANAAVTPRTAIVRLKNNQTNIPTTVSGNSLTNHRFGLSLENYPTVTVSGNTFTPEAGSTDYVHIGVNTKSISSNSNTIVQTAVNGTITSNVFNGTTPAGGTALGFYNHDSDNASLGAFTVGGAGVANSFNSNIATFIRLDNQLGSTDPATQPTDYPNTGTWPTIMACWNQDIDISENQFDVSGSLKTPGAMTSGELTSLEAALFDKSDDGCAGDLITLHLRLDASVYLQGALDTVAMLMRDDLRNASLIPAAQPYGTVATILYSGSETVAPSVLAVTGNNAIVDWVLVELRNSATPATIVARRAALVQRDGDIVDVDGVSPVSFIGLSNNSFYVAVRHRNHLGAMSAGALSLSPVPLVFDLTDIGTPTYGTTAQKTEAGVHAIWMANTRHDDRLKYTGPSNDRDPILVAIGGSTPTLVLSNVYRLEDVNMNGQVKYTGGSNDRDLLLQAIPAGPITGVRVQQLP